MRSFKLIIAIISLSIYMLSCDKENPVTHTECKDFNFKSIVLQGDYGSDSSCVSYTYHFQDKKLFLKHINAGFNCCPGEIYCDIEIVKDTIFLTESEEKADCDCNCLYDIDISISDIAKQKYYISIREPYCNGQEKLIYEIDLVQNETGVFCVERTLYPWGI